MKFAKILTLSLLILGVASTAAQAQVATNESNSVTSTTKPIPWTKEDLENFERLRYTALINNQKLTGSDGIPPGKSDGFVFPQVGITEDGYPLYRNGDIIYTTAPIPVTEEDIANFEINRNAPMPSKPVYPPVLASYPVSPVLARNPVKVPEPSDLVALAGFGVVLLGMVAAKRRNYV